MKRAAATRLTDADETALRSTVCAWVPVAAGALYPAFGWLLDPMIAAAAMTLSSISVIGNALRLRRAAV